MTSKLEDLAEKAKQIAEDAGDSEELARMKQVAAQLGEEAAAVVRKYPLQSVLGAAVAGFLLGSLRRK